MSYDDNHILSQRVTNMSESTYENVLTVKGNEIPESGKYQCCVTNKRGSACSQVTNVEGKAFSYSFALRARCISTPWSVLGAAAMSQHMMNKHS